MMPAFCIDEGVSRELARERAGVLSNVRYRISVRLAQGAARMRGHVEMRFDLAKGGRQLALDFRGDTIRELTVDRSTEEAHRENGHILLSAKGLRQGTNRVEMNFESEIAE